MDPGEDHLSHTGGGQQPRVAPAGHQVPVPQVQKRVKDTFITRCRFGFPREARDEATLLSGGMHEIVPQENVQPSTLESGNPDQQLHTTL